MVTELRPPGPTSMDVLEPWRYHGNLTCREDLALEPLELDLASDDIADVPRYSAAAPGSLLKAFLKDHRPFPAMRHGTDVKKHSVKASPSTPNIASIAKPSFIWTVPEAPTKPLDLRPVPFRLWCGVKRRRPAADVDGFNTAGLSSKKRRLRTELITSRLSQPYSQPATHILNREGQGSGDKRFLKMATSLDMARRIAHLHATSFLRFSVMNRMRKRLGYFVGQQRPRTGNEQEAAAVAASSTFRASWKPQSLQASSAGKSIRPLAPPSSNLAAAPPLTASSSTSPERPGSSSGSPKPHPHPKAHACRLSKPAALPLPVGDLAATKKRTSPRIHPVSSPELRPSGSSLDDLEEDSFAFLHVEDEDWDEGADDPDSVYSDFSVIFGDAAPGGEAQEERTYEEYLDELDGICWVSR